MLPARIVAVGAVSALGHGPRAFELGELGRAAPCAVQRDERFAEAGLLRPWTARVGDAPESDRALALLRTAHVQLTAELDAFDPHWRLRRIGLCIGTSGGAMSEQLGLFAALDDGRSDRALARRAPYFSPFAWLKRELGPCVARSTQVLAACASSTVAIGLGARWVAARDVDLAIVGGYDALSLFIAAGFEVLGATCAAAPLPFFADRNGMALGEGAALAALAPCTGAGASADRIVSVYGFGASCDAVHVTAPDRAGRGLARAAERALDDAGVAAAAIDLISAHGTATPYNDAAEQRAIEALFGARAAEIPAHAFKASVGHTLGAAGVLETLATRAALERGVLPATAGVSAATPREIGLGATNRVASPGHVLKLAAAFGGANAALVLGRGPATPRPLARRPAFLHALGEPRERLDLDLVADTLRAPRAKLERLDAASALAVAAAAAVLRQLPDREGSSTGIVLSTLVASMEQNADFARRLRERGPTQVPPRAFPATSPNLPAGAVAIAFDLRGPCLVLGSGPGVVAEALGLAAELVETGDADAMLVVHVDAVGALASAAWEAAGWRVPRSGALAAWISAEAAGPSARSFSSGEGYAAGGSEPAEPGWPELQRWLEGREGR